MFQSTLPRRERHTGTHAVLDSMGFQSTLPRRERPDALVQIWAAIDVSIHAPAKGATQTGLSCPGIVSCFNPRSREGSDYGNGAEFAHNMVSIHAPAKGATLRNGWTWVRMFRFQSTLPRRERLGKEAPYPCPGCFNPRSREGSDYGNGAEFAHNMVSIHAPAKGATSTVSRGFPPSCCFNPRSREGSDGDGCRDRYRDRSFNPRSREGSDHLHT